MSVTTNNHVRDLVSYADLPADAREEFNYILPDVFGDYDGWQDAPDVVYDGRFFNYRGDWYDANDFVVIESEINPPGMRRSFAHTVPRGHELARWAGIAADSMGTAVVMRWGTDWSGMVDYETVVVGYWVAD